MPLNPTSQMRISFIDSSRGVAAVLVLLQHAYERYFPDPGEYLGSSVLNLGQTGVVVFFLVSGFIIPFSLERSKSIGQFFVNRAFRIYPLYLLVMLLQVGLMLVGIREWRAGSSVFSILGTHLLFLQEYLPSSHPWSENLVMGSWTLFIEAVWYVVFAFLFLRKFNHSTLIWLAITGLFALSLMGLLLEKRLPMGRIGMLFNCVLGLHVYRYFSGTVSQKGFWIPLIAGLGVMYFGIFVAFGHFSSESFSLGCVLTSWSLAYAIFAIFFALRNTAIPGLDQILHFLGSVSYSVYLVHFSVLTLALHHFSPSTAGFFMVLLIVGGLATITYNLIEKPAIQFGKSLFKKPGLRSERMG
jgi:peptidoglycan/LPS O-acetylase OafA/YrhL